MSILALIGMILAYVSTVEVAQRWFAKRYSHLIEQVKTNPDEYSVLGRGLNSGIQN
jgi:hypothetical protein